MIEITISSPYFVADKNSILLTDANFNHYFNTPGQFHTSLGDITANNLLKIADQSCAFVFVDQGFDSESELLKKTKIFLNSISDTNRIQGYLRPAVDTFVEDTVTRSGTPTLWVFGCSLSAGVGVAHTDVYSTQLGRSLKLPVTTVAKLGSSTRWSLRQLLHADIQPGDILIWQLTTIERSTVKRPGKLPKEVMLKDQPREIVVSTTDEQLWFDQISLVEYGVKYLRTAGIKFYMVSLDSNSPVLDRCLEQYTRYPEYCYVPDWQVDLGTDGLHPGPGSHHLLYQFLKKKIMLTQRC
jgi:hypothetical protein